MNKHNNTCILCILLCCTIAFSLCGCQEKKEDENTQEPTDNKFIGRWKRIDTVDYETWTYYTNESVENIIIQNLDGLNDTSIVWFTYTVDSDNICTYLEDISICYTYIFSENSTRLSLYYEDIEAMVLIKTF